MISFKVSNVINLYAHTFVMSLRIGCYCASSVLIHKGLYQSVYNRSERSPILEWQLKYCRDYCTANRAAMASLFCNRTKMCLNIGKQSYSYSAPSSALVNGRISVHLSLIKGASGGGKSWTNRCWSTVGWKYASVVLIFDISNEGKSLTSFCWHRRKSLAGGSSIFMFFQFHSSLSFETFETVYKAPKLIVYLFY